MEYYDPSLEMTSFPMEAIQQGHVSCVGGLIGGKMLLVSNDTGQIIDIYHLHKDTICVVRSYEKSNFLITGDVTGVLIIWKIIESHKSIKLVVFERLHDHQGLITSIFISHDLRCLGTTGLDGFAYLYNAITAKKIRYYHHPSYMPIHGMVISSSPLASVALLCNEEYTIYCFSINGQLLHRLHEKNMQYFLSPTLARDSHGFEYLFYGHEKGEVVMRSMPYLDRVEEKFIATRDSGINSICIDRAGRFLVAACSDGELTVMMDPTHK